MSLSRLVPVDASSARPFSMAFPFDESSESETTPSESSDQAAILTVILAVHAQAQAYWQEISSDDSDRITRRGACSALLQCWRSWWQTRPRRPR